MVEATAKGAFLEGQRVKPLMTQEIPSLEFPLHTLVELTPKPDGKMSENHIKFDVKNKRHAEVGFMLWQSNAICPEPGQLTCWTPQPTWQILLFQHG